MLCVALFDFLGNLKWTFPSSLTTASTNSHDVLKRASGSLRAPVVDVATAYFTVSGFELLRPGLNRIGSFRLLLGRSRAKAKTWAFAPIRSILPRFQTER